MLNTLLDLSALRILVVEDSTEMHVLLRKILHSLGAHHLYEASDGADALEILNIHQIDIVLTDWMMSPVDGLVFTHHVRTANDSRSSMIPVIMISGYTETRHVAEARNSGVTEFLAKPISPIALYRRIEEVILRPRQFVRAKTYTGPDRRRRNEEEYTGPRRRRDDHESTNDAGDEPAAATPEQTYSEA